LLLACIVLHVLAGLKHQFIDRDATLRRMLFQR
jgi:cytochrome b561